VTHLITNLHTFDWCGTPYISKTVDFNLRPLFTTQTIWPRDPSTDRKSNQFLWCPLTICVHVVHRVVIGYPICYHGRQWLLIRKLNLIRWCRGLTYLILQNIKKTIILFNPFWQILENWSRFFPKFQFSEALKRPISGKHIQFFLQIIISGGWVRPIFSRVPTQFF